MVGSSHRGHQYPRALQKTINTVPTTTHCFSSVGAVHPSRAAPVSSSKRTDPQYFLSTMGDTANRKINDAVMNMMVDIDKQFLRKMQADMHRCSVKCCENNDATMEGVQQCLEVCSAPFMRAQKFLQMEFESYQTRLQRCVMDCNDEIKDKIGVNPKREDMNMYTSQFESCAEKCVDKHIALLPTVFEKVKKYLRDNSSY